MSERQFLFMKITALLLLQNGLLAAMAAYFSPDMSTAMMAALAAGVTVFTVATAMMAARLASPAVAVGTPKTPALGRTDITPPTAAPDSLLRSVTPLPTARLLTARLSSQETSAKRLEAAESALNSIDAAARRLASGDLSARLNIPFDSPFEGIRGDLNHAASTFEESMASITMAAGTLHGECAQARLRLHQERSVTTDETPSLSAAGNGIQDIAELLERQTQTVDEISVAMEDARKRLSTEREMAESAARDMVVVDGKLGSATTQMRDIAFRASMVAVSANLAAADTSADADAMRAFASEIRVVAEEGATAARQASVLERDLAKAVARAKTAIDRMVREEREMEKKLESAQKKLEAVSAASQMSADMSARIGAIVTDTLASSGKRRVLDQALETALERMGHELAEINRHCGRFIPVITIHDGMSSPPDTGPPRARGYLRLVKN